MARRFIIGVELLTGLSIGAAAAAAAVSFMTAWLVSVDLRTGGEHMALSSAFTVAAAVDPLEPAESFRRLTLPLVGSGSLESAVLLDGSGDIIASTGRHPSNTAAALEEGWFSAEHPGTGYSVMLRPSGTFPSFIYRVLLTGLAGLTGALALLAFITPRYLSRTVISPLRSILSEADRFVSGGGIDPETAGASFHRLIELLHDRERQLNELKEKAEERADRHERRSSAILSVLGSSVFAIDAEDRLLFFNRQAGEIFALRQSDSGGPFPWERTEGGTILRDILVSAEASEETSTGFQLKGAADRPGRLYSVEISRSGDDETAVLVTDVTRIGELERRIADQTAMADMGAASAGISHEMGNTLCALSGFVDLLARGHSDARTLGILSEVRSEVESARALIGSFGSLARSPEPVSRKLFGNDLESICREACRMYPGRCSIRVEPGDYCVSADDRLLESCVRNIVRNSVEADPSSHICLTVTTDVGRAVISVRDNGPGLPMESEEVFRPFRTSKERGGGNMGLGLSVSRRIVRAMGGELSGANREDGQGAEFTIWLPLQQG